MAGWKKAGPRKKKKTLFRKGSQNKKVNGQGDIEVENEMRIERIMEIREALQNGTYHIDVHKVAHKMLFELWADLNRIKKI